MRIAVTGRNGQVVTSLIERAGVGVEVIALGRPEMDLGDLATIAPAIAAARPDVVVSAAAYTAVDRAESEEEAAFAVNAAGAGAVAAAAQALGVPVIHISTDYVFDGTKPDPYVESDPVAPLGVYGRSKLAGEQLVLATAPDAVILRTAWVYSPFGVNFVKTMLRLAETREELGVVADQIGNPTSALDIADAVLAIAFRLYSAPDTAPRGIFHMTGTGEGSWADLAEAVFAASAALGGPATQVRKITTADYPTPAARPANSRLCCDRLYEAYGLRLPAWRDAVKATAARLVAPVL
ncbi:dTDP-4-dehydrorhamnose reductase [Novosphingobium sp. KACC 22771]|uniref:dTDP-4-dehydrorhamnose reductase n=1 Tax=Novosphingobium sp. KACC 22771 TaxID=3025670 RepID=UPI00236667E0|nr:dTDP-4-dehydrorhamnose reductase [Novosphingobium sp. KACC 22771]WDF74682.1 dTDP-4-dehydrorhamnose reductase [Novosphingobium sp. KACC 22771]